MTPIRIELLGNLRITHGQRAITSVNTNRLQSLLAFLVLHQNAPQSREHLAFVLWPESTEAQARTNLRQLLHHLRRALPADCSLLIADNQTVQWRPDESCTIDAVEFEMAVARAADAGKRGDQGEERRALEEAARLYQDDLLRGLYDDWLQSRRDQLRQHLGHVLARLALRFEEVGDYAAAIRHAERLVTQDPLRESHYQLLIRLHARNHDRASALRAYHQCMRVLKRELAVEPDAATRELFEQVLKAEPIGAPVELPSSAAALPMPLVGRKEEWERLIECWRLAVRGETHLALILGEPGIGKSRLAEELFQWCSRHDGTVARTRCYGAQGQLAYAPVADWLRAAPLRRALSLLPSRQLAELARVLPEILVEHPEIPAPQPLTESWQRRHFYEALNAAFAKAPKPQLLLIDDLQWCDRDSFEWLHSLLRAESRAEPGGRTLVLGTVRPEETGRDHPLTLLLRDLRQSAQATEVAIVPLNLGETAALAKHVAQGELDPAYLDNLYQATKGNPLFVVESVRATLEEAQQDSPARAAVPPRIHAVITARLAQLSPPAFELAGLAGAIGKSFTFDLLVKATDWDEDSVSRALEEMWQRRIIDGQGAGAYDFTHDRLREVAYSELSPVRRRFLHRRIARALEDMHAAELESISGELAAHYEAAGMAEQAIRHYQDAAAVAQRRYAEADAAVLVRRALALCQELPESARRDERELPLLVALGASLLATQGYGTADVGETYARALMLSRRLGEKKYFLSVLSGAWLNHIVRAELDISNGLGQQFLDLARAAGAADLLMTGHLLFGSNRFHLGHFAEAREHIEQALAAHTSGAPVALTLFSGPDAGVFCRSYLSHVLWQLGHADQAAAKSVEAFALARDVSHPFTLAIALNYAAILHVFRQESRTALVRAEEAAALCRKHGFAYYLAWAEILTGWARAMEGDAVAGLRELRQGLDALKGTGAELRLPFYHGLLAQVCGLTGQVAEAQANIATGFAFQRKNGETWAAPELHRIHGDLLLASGNVAEAEASYRRAIQSARETGARLFELRAATRLCRLPLDPTKMAEARAAVGSIYGQLTEGFDAPDLTEARSLLDQTAGGASAPN